VHDLTQTLEDAPPGNLTSLEIERTGPLLLARPRQSGGEARSAAAAGWPMEWPDVRPGRVEELPVAANWKVVVEQWLESESPQRYFLAPNQLLDLTAGSAHILQVVPEAADRSRVLCFELRPGRAAARRPGSVRRGASLPLSRQIALAESTQRALGASPSRVEGGAAVAAALAEFRRSVVTLLPLLKQASNTRR
jgi:hypothetical protein